MIANSRQLTPVSPWFFFLPSVPERVKSANSGAGGRCSSSGDPIGVNALCSERQGVRCLPGGASSVKFLKSVNGADILTAAEHMAGGFKIHKLRSHVLSSPHDAAQLLATRCNESLPRTDIHEHISLAFIGTDSQRLAMSQDELNKDSGTNLQLQLDFGKVMQWLDFLKRVHPAS